MKISLIQLCSGLEPKENLKKIQGFIKEAKEKEGTEVFFLPEVFYSMSDGTKPTPYLVEEGNEHFQAIANLAKNNGVYLIGGSVAYKYKDQVRNRNLNFDPQGNLIEYYDKQNLFAVNLKGKEKSTVIDEADVYDAGSEMKTMRLGDFHLGLSICFDVRFPELYREFYKQGVDLISVSAAFTVPTGKAHWETLLRARAIENQSYVIATGQWGKHNERISTFGHSMVIDPWGAVIAKIEDGEGYITADLDKSFVEKIRGRMNIAPKC